MKKLFILLVAVAGFAASSLYANVTGVQVTGVSGGLDGAGYWDEGPAGDLTGVGMYSYQSAEGSMGMNIYTDNQDPVFTLNTDTFNSSTFTWTSYTVDVSMSLPFTITGAVDNIPGDWSAGISQPGAPVAGIYTGHIVYNAGTPVLIGGEFNFTYQVSFTGGPVISFSENLTPAPEPASIGLLALGALVVGGRRFLKAR